VLSSALTTSEARRGARPHIPFVAGDRTPLIWTFLSHCGFCAEILRGVARADAAV
jgi:hypothetical protein